MSIETSGAPTAESPTAENETENGAAVAAEGSTTAESSNADETDAKPADLLSVVKDAVKPDETVEAASSTAEGEEEAKPAEGEAKPEGEAKAEDQAEADAKLPFHDHPRWKEVIAERNSFKEDAGRYRQVEGFMREHGLSAQEVGEGFDIMAKLKSGDPANLTEVREYFAKNLALLDDALGNVLPDDLRERVEGGLVDEETAKELAATRAKDRLRTNQAETRERTETQSRERDAAVAAANASAKAVEDWEARTKAADPDYAKKADLVEVTCRAIVMETGRPPRNPEEAVKLAEDAYQRVSRQLKGMLPTPKAVTPAPKGSSATATAQPKTLREAIAASLG